MALRAIEGTGGPFYRTFSRGARPIRDLHGLGTVLGAIGSLELRLATTKKEIRKAQKLRYRVFFEEGGAVADPTARLIRRDVCPFDRVCDHLIVIDRARGGSKVVGAYRLLRQEVAEANFGFYSAGEFEVADLIARHRGKRFLELGRSCVAKDYRGRPALELLWRGIWAYALRHRIDVMFGCASLEGVRPADHAAALGRLARSATAGAEWEVAAANGRGVEIAALVDSSLDPRTALRMLPPLVKGYWRLGAKFGAQAVVDEKFGTTDVFVVMPIAEIEGRYLRYFAPLRETAPLAA